MIDGIRTAFGRLFHSPSDQESSELEVLVSETRYLAGLATALLQTGLTGGVAAIALALAAGGLNELSRWVVGFAGFCAVMAGTYVVTPLLVPDADEVADLRKQVEERRRTNRLGLLFILTSVLVPSGIVTATLVFDSPG